MWGADPGSEVENTQHSTSNIQFNCRLTRRGGNHELRGGEVAGRSRQANDITRFQIVNVNRWIRDLDGIQRDAIELGQTCGRFRFAHDMRLGRGALRLRWSGVRQWLARAGGELIQFELLQRNGLLRV